MAIPKITPLPPAPTRADGAVDFSSKADALVAAWPPTIVALNASYLWVAQQMDAAEGFKNAAADFAKSASVSAQAANTSSILAHQAVAAVQQASGAQVQLAAEQVALAVTARNEAQALAEAAGAGVPADRRLYTSLQIKGDGTVAWRDRNWIGEVVIAVAAQDSTYIQTGGIYLQSAYPQLFKAIGKIATPGVYSFQSVTNTSGYIVDDMASDGNGTWIVASTSTTGSGLSTIGYVLRSIDDGKTWATVSVPRLIVQSVRFVDGIWVIAGRLYDASDTRIQWAYSTTDGASWVFVGRLANSPNSRRVTLSVGDDGLLVLTGDYRDLYGKSTAWNSVFIPSNVLSSPSSAWSDYNFAAGTGSSTHFLENSVGGSTRVGDYVIVVGELGKIARCLVTSTTVSNGSVVTSGVTNNLNGVAAKGDTVIAVGAAGTILRSSDQGATFRPSAVSVSPDFTAIEGMGSGVWVAGTSAGALWISTDDGFTFTQTIPSGVSTRIYRVRGAGNTVIIGSEKTIRRSDSLYNYDQNAQFLVPAVPAPNGLKSFIKAKEAV